LNNYFEYYQQQLPCNLIQGQVYNMSFYTAHAGLSEYFCYDVGLYASVTQPTNLSGSLQNGQLVGTPQISANVDSTGWTNVSGTITGNNESWITIGYFGPLGNCPAAAGIQPNNAPNYQYNYLDDVVITPMPPTLSTSIGTQTVCVGVSPTTFSLIETGSPSTYCTWTGPNGFSASGSSVSVTVPSTQGTYTYQCSVALPCYLCNTPLTSTISITVSPLNASGSNLTITETPSVVCANPSTGTGTVHVSVIGAPHGASYIWLPPLNTHSINYNNGTISEPAGVYTYSVTTSGCSGLATTTFTINPFPVFPLNSTSPSICYGVNTATLTAGDPSNTYSWTPSTGLSTITGSVVIANPSSTNLSG